MLIFVSGSTNQLLKNHLSSNNNHKFFKIFKIINKELLKNDNFKKSTKRQINMMNSRCDMMISTFKNESTDHFFFK